MNSKLGQFCLVSYSQFLCLMTNVILHCCAVPQIQHIAKLSEDNTYLTVFLKNLVKM